MGRVEFSGFDGEMAHLVSQSSNSNVKERGYKEKDSTRKYKDNS